MGTKSNAYRILIRIPEEKRPVRRPRCKWEYNMKVDLEYLDLIWFKIGTSGRLF
jgi:hypothetical protein